MLFAPQPHRSFLPLMDDLEAWVSPALVPDVLNTDDAFVVASTVIERVSGTIATSVATGKIRFERDGFGGAPGLDYESNGSIILDHPIVDPGNGYSLYTAFHVSATPSASRGLAALHGGAGSSNQDGIWMDILGAINARSGNSDLGAAVDYADGAPHHVLVVVTPGDDQLLYVDRILKASATGISQSAGMHRLTVGAAQDLAPSWGTDGDGSRYIGDCMLYWAAHTSTAQRERNWDYLERLYHF